MEMSVFAQGIGVIGGKKVRKGLTPFPPTFINHYSDLQKVKYQKPELCRFHDPDLVMGENLVLPQSTWVKQNRYLSARMENSVIVKYLRFKGTGSPDGLSYV
jgi:hypothetical protein